MAVLRISGDLSVQESDLPEINTTELVYLCRAKGVMVHRGIRREILEDVLRGKQPPTILNPVDHKRDEMMAFLKRFWAAIESQLEVRCSGNCYHHTDMLAVSCWDLNKRVIERYKDE